MLCSTAPSGAEQLLHPVHLRQSLESGRAVLFHDLKNLVPQKVGLLLVGVRHLDEGRGNRTTRGGVLAEQTVGTDSLVALDEMKIMG